MQYIFRKNYTMQNEPSGPPLVLLAEPEPEALALYARHLTRANLLVNVCLELSGVLRQIQHASPQLLIINPSADIAYGLVLLRKISSRHPELPIITIGGAIPDPYLDRLMASGVAFHLNRSLTQPRDIAVAARQILGLN